MPLVYECDRCGVQRQDTRIPEAWRVFWRQDADRMGYACPGAPAAPARRPGAGNGHRRSLRRTAGFLEQSRRTGSAAGERCYIPEWRCAHGTGLRSALGDP